MDLVANIFSLIGAGLLAYSTFSKKKSRMLWIQVGDCFFNAAGCLLITSYAAAVTNLISMIRNILNAKKKNNKIINCILILVIVIIGLIVNTKGIIGLLPILASVEYTVCSFISKSAQSLRWALVFNVLLWLVHDFCVGLYPSMIIDVVILSVTVVNIIRQRRVR